MSTNPTGIATARDSHASSAQGSPIPKPRIGINLLFMKPGELTGPGIYAQRLTDVLLDQGNYDWFLFCHRELKLPEDWDSKAKICRISIGSSRFLRVLHEQMKLPLHCRHEHIDLLFSPGFVSPLWGVRRKIVAIPDMYYEVIPQVLPPMQRRYWKMFIPLSVRRCNQIIAISNSTANDIVKYIPSARGKVTVTHLASAVEDSQARGDPIANIEPGYVLYVANVVANKNPRSVAKAAAMLAKQGRSIPFVHVGVDHYSLLQRALTEFHVDSNFRLLGRVSAAQLRWLYRNALCAILPSIYEGFGMPALEAQEYGAPLICSSAGSLAEVAGNGALYFEPLDAARLAELISNIDASPQLRQTLIRKGKENCMNFTWERTAQKTLQVFSQSLCPSQPDP